MTSDIAASILIVEDNPADAYLAKKTIRRIVDAVYDVHCVNTLQEGVTLLNSQRFDAVLLDLGLPECSGLDTLRNLCRLHPGVAIIVVSGGDSHRIATKVIEEGAVDYLAKSQLNPDTLQRAISKAIQHLSQTVTP